ncbi:glycosyltransferase [Microbacterium insulae]|uniref:D-inositol 3-phosphate glycosyltransferase n=1 Tax=Microbacterium insulae TaxID=483014 RepID=A0ABW3ADL8_9MICO
MRVAMTKGSLLIPPTYFAVAHPVALAGPFDFRFFVGAASITDEGAREAIDVDDTVSRLLPFTDGWPVRRREQLGALLTAATARAVQAWRPDIIHQHFAYGSRAAVRASRTCGAPSLVTVHGGDAFVPLSPPSSRRPLGRPALARMKRDVAAMYAQARAVLAVSSYIADIAARGGADVAKLIVHYQGVDTELFRPRSAERAETPRVLFVGRLSEVKGVHDLVEASIAAVRSRPHELVFVGDGPERSALDRAAEHHPHIRITGSLTSDRVREELTAAHVLVLPTRVNGIAREAAGLVLLEAQACEVPVIAYDSGGTSEMLRDGETGWLVPEADTAALAARLLEALSLSAEERDDLGRRGRGFVVAERSLARSAEELAEIYRELPT